MNVSKYPLIFIPLRNGLITGLIGVIIFISIFYLGQHPIMIAPYFDYRIFLFGVFIFFTCKEIRDNYQDGILYFWQAMTASYLVVFVATIIGSLGLLLFSSVETDFIPSYIQGMSTYLRGFPEEAIERIGREIYDRNLELLPATNATGLMETYFIQGIVIGFFVSIILSTILRRQPKTN